MKKQITRQTIIADAVKINPQAPQIMFTYGLHCIGCHVSLWETIEQGCMGHGMDSKQIDKMVDELNKGVENGAKKTKVRGASRPVKKAAKRAS
jgi:hybrid cluster-associated redox disulfide protein